MPNKIKNKNFAIIGLGRFGTSIAETLSEYDVDVMACDKDLAALNAVSDLVTHAVHADLNFEEEIKKLGLGNFDVVIVALGGDFEASQITAMIAKEQGARRVVVKASNKRQKKILETIGTDEVILPEYEMGAKLAKKLVDTNILDILEESDDYTMLEMYPLAEWAGKTIQQLDIHRKHNVFILAMRRGGKLVIPVALDTILQTTDVLITISDKSNKK